MDTRIKIYEQDLTTSQITLDNTEVAYVPGFATAGDYRTPTYCDSLSTFLSLFVDSAKGAPTFTSKQYYPRYSAATKSNDATRGFIDIALDLTKIDGSGNVPWFEAGEQEPSFVYACELLSAGMPIVFERLRTTDEDVYTVADFYGQLTTDNYISGYDEPAVFASPANPNQPYILDKGAYNIKYITSGGYPTFEYKGYNIAQAMANIASSLIVDTQTQSANGRGDCIALIDHTNYSGRMLSGHVGPDLAPTACSVYYSLTHCSDVTISGNGSNSAMFTPWGEYSLLYNYSGTVASASSSMEMPASFAYLRCVVKSQRTNPSWLAISGVSRGLVPSLSRLCTDKTLTNTIAESYQVEEGTSQVAGAINNYSINPITYIRPYGLCIWGNRTLLDYKPSENGFATLFLNVRNLLCDVKKQAFLSAQSLMFEPNDEALWVNFKALMTPLLDNMVSASCLSNYKMLKSTSSDSQRTKLSCQIILYPIYSVESFTIEITLSDEDVSVS